MRLTRSRLAAAGTVPLLLLAGCGDDGGDSAASSSKASATATPLTVQPSQVASINAAAVSLSNPKKPTVKLNTVPFHVNATTTKVTKQGTGRTVGAKDIAYTSYVAVNGTTGKTIESTFGKTSAAFNLGNQGTFPGLVKALKGKKVGTEMVVAVPPSDGFGGTGNKEVNVTSKDTMVFYVKINDTYPLLEKATGKTVSPKAGLPTVKIANTANAQATITVPKNTKAPTKLVDQPLIQGEGPKVVAGQTILASYTGVVWSSGKVFDSSAKQGQPATFQIGAKAVISGWDKAIVGERIGSRLLIVVPPSEGYGSEGNTQAGIKGTDTLVFVVDILAAV
ncbi:FKBP-type peptidyl-prolyl cis-trans isomerase [Dermacoccaceae bacterium W4C1]